MPARLPAWLVGLGHACTPRYPFNLKSKCVRGLAELEVHSCSLSIEHVGTRSLLSRILGLAACISFRVSEA